MARAPFLCLLSSLHFLWEKQKVLTELFAAAFQRQLLMTPTSESDLWSAVMFFPPEVWISATPPELHWASWLILLMLSRSGLSLSFDIPLL